MPTLNVNSALQRAVQHHQAGQLAEAEKLYRQVLAAEPNHPDALHLLGMVALKAGRLDEADVLISRAIALMPNVPAYRTTLDAGRREKAASLTEAARQFRNKRELDEATKLCAKAIELVPDFADAYNVIGAIRKDGKDLDGAILAWTKAIQIDPGCADAHSNLGVVYAGKLKFDDAIIAYQNAIRAKANHGEANFNLALILMDQGRIEEARKGYEHSLSLMPDSSDLESSRLFLLECDPSIKPAELFQAHDRWNNKYGKRLNKIEKHANNREPDRRLRVGYVSSDVRTHPVMTFAEVLFADSAPERIETFCYSNTSTQDATTAEIKNLPIQWREITSLSDEDADRLIRADKIDILVDLNGHTGDNRLTLFARKPAPVQVTYLGYPDTTGLSAIDYRLTDAYADPPGRTERFHSEELVRLPSTFLCLRPREAPAIKWSPSGRITFGSFNVLRKVNQAVVRQWSEILRSVPDSRLLLKSTAAHSEVCRRRFIDLFASHGITSDQLVFRSWATTYREHLQLYNEIDIALDPFPYNGTTTTCEALWMGVPTVVLAGESHRGRVGVSILSNVGIPELIADTNEQYVKIAVDLANDLPRLGRLRGSLRDQMRRSPLLDRARFVINVEIAFREMWQRWCRTVDEIEVAHPSPSPNIREKAASLTETARQLRNKRELKEAAQLCLQAIALIPDFADAYNLLGAIYKDQNDPDRAVLAWKKAIQIDPHFAEPHSNLGVVYAGNLKFDDAIIAYQDAIQANPNYAQAHINLSLVLMDQGRIAEALQSLDRGSSLVPDSPTVGSLRLCLLECDPSIHSADLLQEHSRWGRRYGQPPGKIEKHTNHRDPNRRLRVGYVSSDVQAHPVMTFAKVLFRDAPADRIETYCYSSTFTQDATTAEIKKLPIQWRDITNASDEDADRLIRNDKIDVLVDLSGHTADNRLTLFARKPAPVQVTYLGYPDTTGLSTVGYRLTDAYADPPGTTERFHTEELVRLPSTFLCFPPEEAPAIKWSPGERITFGSFNVLRKVNEAVIERWSEILLRVADSRLLLKSTAATSEICRQRFIGLFASHGIASDRLIFRNWAASHYDHLQMYNEIDICLDPFPYNGTTTTCEALWMGVPVVVLAGERHSARVGVSLLSNAGIPELIADSVEDYVKKAVELANDLPRLAHLRGSLREQMRRSPLMDSPRFMRNIEAAYRQMWQRWCAEIDGTEVAG
jgi:predicted O-linked N-acetylglucosamine transferase (SPINDLY family)